MRRRFTIRTPDNAHCHFRDPDDPVPEDRPLFWSLFEDVVAQFGRSVHFGNYKPGGRSIVNAERVRHNRAIFLGQATLLGRPRFQPLMTIMMTPETTPDTIYAAVEAGIIGVKSLPAYGSTNSHAGIHDFEAERFHDNLHALGELGIPWLSHCETPDPSMSAVLREADFIERTLAPALDRHPNLRVSFEHLSTREGARFVLSAQGRVFCNVAPHHLQVTTAEADVNPFLQCAPYPKGREHVDAVCDLVLSGSPLVGFGDDRAAHRKVNKLVKPPLKPAFGVYHRSSVCVMGEFFDDHNAMHLFQPVMSENFARWHGLSLNDGTITIEEDPWREKEECHGVVPYRAGQVHRFRVVELDY